jgi:hypothetical protein
MEKIEGAYSVVGLTRNKFFAEILMELDLWF